MTLTRNNFNRIVCKISLATRISGESSVAHCIKLRKKSIVDQASSLFNAPFFINNLSSRAACDPKIILEDFSLHHAFLRRFCTTTCMPKKLPVLTLYTKQPCPLCDQALSELKPLLEQVNLQKVDITAPENKVWWNAYRYDIPVFHLNGKFLMKHKADLEKLKIALENLHMDNKSL